MPLLNRPITLVRTASPVPEKQGSPHRMSAARCPIRPPPCVARAAHRRPPGWFSLHNGSSTMEFNTNKKVDLTETRFVEVRRASEMRGAELKATVERVKNRSEENAEVLARIQAPTDSIEISAGLGEAGDAGRSERIAELRSAVEDGSLFNQDRLERAASRLLSDRL